MKVILSNTNVLKIILILLFIIIGTTYIFKLYRGVFDDCSYNNMLNDDILAQKCLQKDMAVMEAIRYNASLYFRKLDQNYKLTPIHLEAIEKMNLNYKSKEIKNDINITNRIK